MAKGIREGTGKSTQSYSTTWDVRPLALRRRLCLFRMSGAYISINITIASLLTVLKWVNIFAEHAVFGCAYSLHRYNESCPSL